jgi:hypothetical protein
MPEWADENGRYWFKDTSSGSYIEIPHAPVERPKGCLCACCRANSRDNITTPSHGRRNRRPPMR